MTIETTNKERTAKEHNSAKNQERYKCNLRWRVQASRAMIRTTDLTYQSLGVGALSVLVAVVVTFTSCGSTTPAISEASAANAKNLLVDDRCAATTDSRPRYVRTNKRDTLEQYASILIKNGRRIALTAGGRKFGEIIVIATALGWALLRDRRADSDSYTLKPTDAALHQYLGRAPLLVGGGTTPHTKQQIALGDPVSKVIRLYGNGKPTPRCVLSERAFAGPGAFGDWFALYRADARGKIVFIRTGDVSNGIRHLWQ